MIIALIATSFLLSGVLRGVRSQARETRLTKTAHLDLLLDQVTVSKIAGHSTDRISAEPEVTMPWTYADARDLHGPDRQLQPVLQKGREPGVRPQVSRAL